MDGGRLKAAASREATMTSHREARIAGLSLAAVYAVCLLLTAIGMS